MLICVVLGVIPLSIPLTLKVMSNLYRIISYRTEYFLPIIEQSFVSANTFIACFALSRFSSPKELGLFSIALSMIIFISIFQGALITRPMNVVGNIIENRDRDFYFNSAANIQIIIILISVMVAFIFFYFWNIIMKQSVIGYILT